MYADMAMLRVRAYSCLELVCVVSCGPSMLCIWRVSGEGGQACHAMQFMGHLRTNESPAPLSLYVQSLWSGIPNALLRRGERAASCEWWWEGVRFHGVLFPPSRRNRTAQCFLALLTKTHMTNSLSAV